MNGSVIGALEGVGARHGKEEGCQRQIFSVGKKPDESWFCLPSRNKRVFTYILLVPALFHCNHPPTHTRGLRQGKAGLPWAAGSGEALECPGSARGQPQGASSVLSYRRHEVVHTKAARWALCHPDGCKKASLAAATRGHFHGQPFWTGRRLAWAAFPEGGVLLPCPLWTPGSCPRGLSGAPLPLGSIPEVLFNLDFNKDKTKVN